MRVLGYILIFGLIVSFSSSCKLCSKPGTSDNLCKELIVTSPNLSTPIAEGVSVTKIFMEGGCLSVRIKFSGCENSGFDLMYNGRSKKSLPPQVNLMLKPLDVSCESTKEIEREFKYDIKKLQGISEDGKVVIRVQNFTESLVYEY